MVVIVIQQYLQLVVLVGPVTSAPGGSNAQATSPVQSIVNFGTGGAQHGIAYSEQNAAVAGSGANGTCFTGGSGGGSVRGSTLVLLDLLVEMQKIEVEEVVVDVITMHVMEVLETLLELMQVVNILVQVVVIMELVV